MRRSQAQIDQDRAYIADLLSRCPHWTPEQVRDELARNRTYEVQLGAVKTDIKSLQKQWRESAIRDFDEMRGQEAHSIDVVQAFCYSVFFGEASEKDVDTFLGKTMPKQRMESVVRSFDYILDENNEMTPRPTGFQTKVEQLRGNAEFLKSCLLDCSRARRELFGLDAPKKAELSGPGGKPLEIDAPLQFVIDKAYGEAAKEPENGGDK